MARLSRYCDREAVMRNATKLRGTNIFVDEDLCPASHAAKIAKMPLLKQAKSQGKVAFFRHTRLIIREKHSDSDAAGRGRQPTSDGGNGAVVPAHQQTMGDVGAVGGVKPGSTARRFVDLQVAGVWSD